MILRGSGGTEGGMNGWGMNVTLKERLYKHTHIHLGMIELHADFFFQWQAKYHYTSKLSGTKYAALK